MGCRRADGEWVEDGERVEEDEGSEGPAWWGDHVYVGQLEDLNLGTPLAGDPDLQVQC